MGLRVKCSLQIWQTIFPLPRPRSSDADVLTSWVEAGARTVVNTVHTKPHVKVCPLFV
jgi:hypothetical protein